MPILAFADMLAEHTDAGFEQVAQWDLHPARPRGATLPRTELIGQALLLMHPETGVFARLTHDTFSSEPMLWATSVHWAFNALVFDLAAFLRLPLGMGFLMRPGGRRVYGLTFEDATAGIADAEHAQGLFVGGWSLTSTEYDCSALLDLMRACSTLVTPHRVSAVDALYIEPPERVEGPVDRPALDAWKVARAEHLDRIVRTLPVVARRSLIRAV